MSDGFDELWKENCIDRGTLLQGLNFPDHSELVARCKQATADLNKLDRELVDHRIKALEREVSELGVFAAVNFGLIITAFIIALFLL